VTAAIAEYERGWPRPWVEGEVFGTHAPGAVARELEDFAEREFPAPRPFGAPAALRLGFATTEELLDTGGRRDAHDPFDFAATRAGTEWVDEFAARARSGLRAPAGDVVVGRGDWSVKHFRSVGDRVSAVYDWDSLVATDEPRIIGQAGASFEYLAL
jgi:hypothetical protein